MATILDTNLNFNKHFKKDEVLNNFLINDIFSKCKKYKNSIFETYDKYNYDTVYAIGDIHGDYKALIKILKHIDCIVKEKDKYKWNPKLKNTCIVQVGDIMGRKDPEKENHVLSETYKSNEIEIIKLLLKLSDEAIKYKSRIILLYGNHDIRELFNTIDCIKINNFDNKHTSKKCENIALIKEFSKLKGDILCNYHSICIVNSYIFCHAGIVYNLIQKLMSLFNITDQQFVSLDISDKLFLINICMVGIFNGILSDKFDKNIAKIIRETVYNIFYHREYSKGRHVNEDEIFDLHKINIMKNLLETKMLFNVKGIVIGHNQTLDCKVHKFDNLYYIDVKISEAFGSDIKNDINQILKIKKDKKPEIIEVNNK